MKMVSYLTIPRLINISFNSEIICSLENIGPFTGAGGNSLGGGVRFERFNINNISGNLLSQ